MLAGRISPSGAVMSSGNWISTAAELLALAMYVFLAYWLLMKLVEWLARKTARKKRNKPKEDESAPHHRNYGTRRDGKKSGRQFWRRGWYERRYPEWERWNGKQTDYVGEHLSYALVSLPQSGVGANRYLCYQAKEIKGLWDVTVVYLRGSATLEDLNNMFNKKEK